MLGAPEQRGVRGPLQSLGNGGALGERWDGGRDAWAPCLAEEHAWRQEQQDHWLSLVLLPPSVMN